MRRAFRRIFVDHGFHAFMTCADPWLRSPALLAGLYRWATPILLLRKRPTIDRSDRALTLAHHLYRHVELELAIPAESIEAAAEVIRSVTEMFAGRTPSPGPSVAEAIGRSGLQAQLEGLVGSFTLNYPMSFRYVRRDDTLMSQSSAGPVYTVSFFTYAKDTRAFERYAAFMTQCLVRAFDARPHFGKLFFLQVDLQTDDRQTDAPQTDDVARLYGESLGAFMREIDELDPAGAFGNAFTRRVLGA